MPTPDSHLSRWIGFATLILYLGLAGCDRLDQSLGGRGSVHEVKVDASYSKMSERELDRVERDAIEQLVGRAPVSKKATLRDILENKPFTVERVTDPATARLMGIVLSARDARERRRPATAADVDGRTIVPVRVEMVKEISSNGVKLRALVKLARGAQGIPTLIIPENATPGDVERGLRAAISVASRVGKNLTSPTVIRLTRSPSVSDDTKRGRETLKQVRAMPKRTDAQKRTKRVTEVAVLAPKK